MCVRVLARQSRFFSLRPMARCAPLSCRKGQSVPGWNLCDHHLECFDRGCHSVAQQALKPPGVRGWRSQGFFFSKTHSWRKVSTAQLDKSANTACCHAVRRSLQPSQEALSCGVNGHLAISHSLWEKHKSSPGEIPCDCRSGRFDSLLCTSCQRHQVYGR
jgi:hypothetical protein